MITINVDEDMQRPEANTYITVTKTSNRINPILRAETDNL